MDIEEIFAGLSKLFKHAFGKLVLLLAIALIGLGLFRVAFVNSVDNYQAAYKFDMRTGALTPLFKKTGTEPDGKPKWHFERGWIVTLPFLVKVHTVDLRPVQVCINANKRVLNCKLVEFNPEGLQTFVGWHGRKDYDGDSTTTEGRPTPGGFNDILTSYAYDGSGKKYPFLNVIRELKPEEVAQK